MSPAGTVRPEPRPFELVVTDLDGTLVRRDLTIDSRDAEAVRRVRQQGVEITVATGRILAAARRYLEQVQVTAPVILYNGAVILDPHTREVCFERRIPCDQARRALALLRAYPLDAQVYLEPEDEGYFVEQITPNVEAFTVKDGIFPQVVPDLISFLNRDPLKLLLIGPPPALARYRAEVQRAGLGLETVRSEANFLELLPLGVSKGLALRRLCALLGIPLARVVALGDNPNDAEMLWAAGLGIAMASGARAVHRAADLVVPSVAEGLAQAFGLAE